MLAKRLAFVVMLGAVLASVISPAGAEILGPAATPNGSVVSPIDLGPITGTIIGSFVLPSVSSANGTDTSNYVMAVLQDSSRGNQLDFLYQWTYVSSTAPTSECVSSSDCLLL